VGVYSTETSETSFITDPVSDLMIWDLAVASLFLEVVVAVTSLFRFTVLLRFAI